MNAALLESTTEGERLRLAATGAWTAQHARALETLIDAETRKHDAIKGVVIDLAGIERLDTFGAWLLERLVRGWKARGGDTMVDVLDSLVSIANMLGAVAVALGRIAVRPRSFRFTAMVHHLDNVGWRAVPIILLITFLIGCIIAQQGIFH